MTTTAETSPDLAEHLAALERNKDLLRRHWAEVLNAQNWEVADEIIREDYIQHNPTIPTTRDGLKLGLIGFAKSFTDISYNIDWIVAEGDFVWVHQTVKGTHTGTFMDLPPTGRSMAVHVVDLFRIQGGQLAEHWDVIDNGQILQQLGFLG